MTIEEQLKAALEENDELKAQISRQPLTQDEVFDALGLAMKHIEKGGANTELTTAVIIVDDVRRSLGNRFNPADPYAAAQVRRHLPVTF